MSYSSCHLVTERLEANVGNYIIDLEDVIGSEYHVGELRERVDPQINGGLAWSLIATCFRVLFLTYICTEYPSP